jgi:hypothetical protein
MRRKTLVTLAALSIIASSSVSSRAADPECISTWKVHYVANHIPRFFKQVRQDTYLIEDHPESRNGHNKGGQLVVWQPRNDGYLAIYDRTDRDPANWYEVDNYSGSHKGCVANGKIPLQEEKRRPDVKEAQSLFNKLVQRIHDHIDSKVRGLPTEDIGSKAITPTWYNGNHIDSKVRPWPPADEPDYKTNTPTWYHKNAAKPYEK